jgi:hypothetical protein
MKSIIIFFFLIVFLLGCSPKYYHTTSSENKFYKIEFLKKTNQIEIIDYESTNKDNYVLLTFNINDIKHLYFSIESMNKGENIIICSDFFPISHEKYKNNKFLMSKGVNKYTFGPFANSVSFINSKLFKKLNISNISSDSISNKCKNYRIEGEIKIGN